VAVPAATGMAVAVVMMGSPLRSVCGL